MFRAVKELKDYLVIPPTLPQQMKVTCFYFSNGHKAPMDFSYIHRGTTKFQIISNDDKNI